MNYNKLSVIPYSIHSTYTKKIHAGLFIIDNDKMSSAESIIACTFLNNYNLVSHICKSHIICSAEQWKYTFYTTPSDTSLCHINKWLHHAALTLSAAAQAPNMEPNILGSDQKSLKARCRILFLWCLHWCLVQANVAVSWSCRGNKQIWLLSSRWLMLFRNVLFLPLLDFGSPCSSASVGDT